MRKLPFGCLRSGTDFDPLLQTLRAAARREDLAVRVRGEVRYQLAGSCCPRTSSARPTPSWSERSATWNNARRSGGGGHGRGGHGGVPHAAW